MQLGNKIAPTRFVAFGIAFAIGLAVLIPLMGKGLGTMAAFDIASALFLALVAPLLRSKVADMRKFAKENDANRALLLGLSAVVLMVILVSVASEMQGDKGSAIKTALLIATLV